MAKSKESKRRFPPLLLAIGGAFLLILVLSIPIPTDEEVVPLNQIVRDIEEGKVQSIMVSGEQVTVTYTDEQTKMAQKEMEVSFIESLSRLGLSEEKLRNTEITFKQDDVWSWLGPLSISLIPSVIILWLFWRTLQGAQKNANQALDFTKARARLFGAGGKKEEKQTKFSDVGGLEQAKQELKEIVDFLESPEKYFKIGAKIPRGVLLIGPPGTGKTLLARAIASEANVPFFSVSGSEFMEMFVGVGASRVRNLFAQAKKAGKAIIFIDEIDSVGKSRGTGLSGGGLEEREQTLNQILTEMDGFENRSEVIVIGATNKPETLDRALLRPGRFDRRVVLDAPDIKDRTEVLEIHSKNKPFTTDVNLQEISERTPGFSGADLESLVNEAALLAARHNRTKITQDDLLDSIERVMLGPERKNHLLNDKEKRITAFHEAGHAIVAHATGAEKVRKVSVIARGMAAGYTLKAPENERRLMTKKDFINEIATLFGGFIAEQIEFKEVTTGASNDIMRANKIARALVKKYGMSDLGPISFDDEFGNIFERRLLEDKAYSEKMSEKIDQEVLRILETGRRLAEKLLKNNREKLTELSEILVEKETIEKEEFEKIMSKE